MMNKKIWQEFTKWGSRWTLEAERDYLKKDKPLIYHLKMFGAFYLEEPEFVGDNLEKLFKKAIKHGQNLREGFMKEIFY